MPRSTSSTSNSSAVGDLADIVAHGLSAIAIQAEAAEAVLRTDPTLAAVPLASIRGSALEALADMRRLLTALRDEEDACGRTPQPGLDQLPPLVARARAMGQPVTLELAPAPRPLPASLQLAAFRVVQEALSSAREHAPGSVTTVQVAPGDASIEVTVSDAGAEASARNLDALEARVLLHGGRLEAGPEAGGGYRIRATFPA